MDRVLFAPLTKVVEQDDGTVEIFARAVEEVPDPKGELFDYASSKPEIVAWSEGIRKASDGKSLGNLRAMHNPQIAAGKLTGIIYLDEQKAVDIVAKVVDMGEVKKVREGVYTGISIGGAYARKWQDGPHMRYTARPSEFSLADNPMMKNCRITLVKVDGRQEEIPLQKRISHVARMAELLYSFRCLAGDVFYEAEQEKDGSPVPGRLGAALVNLVEIFREFAAEEAGELVADIQQFLAAPAAAIGNPMAMVDGAQAGKPEPLIKAGARHTAGELAQIQTIHDHAVSLGAACQGGVEKMAKTELQQILEKVEGLAGQVTQLSEQLTKVQGDYTAQGEQLTKVETENTALKDRMAKVEAQPAAAKGALKAVGKGEDVQPLGKVDGPTEEEMIKNKDTQGLIKAAWEKPISFG